MDNRIAPDDFGRELGRQGGLYGKCIVAPERIGNAVATVIALDDCYDNVYLEHKLATIGDPVKKQLGWNPSRENTSNALHNFKKAFESGDLAIFDERLLSEMRTYSRADFMNTSSLVTNHYDLLRAAIIAYDMRDHATISDDEEEDVWDNDYQVNSSI